MSEQVEQIYDEIFSPLEIVSPPEKTQSVNTTEVKQYINATIQIASSVVKNGKITGNAFAVYYYLKYKSFKNWDDKIILQIDHKDMKDKLGLKDNRTIIVAMKVLYENGLIEEEITKMPIHSLLKVTLVEIEPKPFTQLPIQLFDKIPSIKPNGLRLLYYYESFINRTDIMKDFSFPSFETIAKGTGLNHKTIDKFNQILKKNRLIKIVKHKIHFDNPINENRFDRYNNHYHINLYNIKELS